MIELLIIVATTVTLAAAGGEDSKKDCLQSIYVADINHPQITAIVYNASMLGQIHFLCFTLSNQGNTARKGLTVRLDYLPYLCIEASNDNPMNKVQDDGWY